MEMRRSPARRRGARARCAALLVACCSLAGTANAQQAPEPKGIGSPGYRWNAMNVEKIDALELVPDPENGKAAYQEECAGCHLANGAGRPDGKIPQVAGQHDTVLIKQISDIRAGRRENPVMHPYSMKLIDAQEIADVSAYLEALPIPPGNGKGPGAHVATGERLYRRDCARCHGSRGEGSEEKFFPVLSGQHYDYLLRQIRDVATGGRHNAIPEMVKVVKAYQDEQMRAVADYLSRLPWPPQAGQPKR